MKKWFLNTIKKILGIDKVFKNQQRILSSLENQNKQLNEIYKSNLFQSSIQDNDWLINKGLSPGNWAGDFSFMYTIYRVLNDMRPEKIVEFGLGQTSKMISQYSSAYNIEYMIFEHDKKWYQFFSTSYILPNNCKLVLTNLITIKYKGFDTLRYEIDLKKNNINDIELIVSDGPFGSPRFSRIQVLDLIPNRINKNNFCILIDDYNRIGEKDTVEEILQLLEVNGISYKTKKYTGYKEHYLICSSNNSFLTTL